MNLCYSRDELSYVIGATAFGIFVSTALSGYAFQSNPLSQLGHRPIGNGLLSYLWNYYKQGVGVWGYDPILGAFAPPLRARFHFVAALTFWYGLLRAWPEALIPDQCDPSTGIKLSFFQSGAVALSMYAFAYFVVHYLFPGVSHPGGPRPHKIQRVPKWEDSVSFPPSVAEKWRCVVAQESHEISDTKFADTSAVITGEPSGRQIWTNSKTIDNKSSIKVDEKLVAEMAGGGRVPGFNPSKNPNSCDKLFRAQQIRGYLARGNKPPSKSQPKSVEEALKKAGHFYSMLQTTDGHWAGDYGGPHFLLPGLVVAWYIMGKPSLMIDDEAAELMKHYIMVHQQADGGWGTHVESPSTMFGTTLMYVALRLLGVGKDDDAAVMGRKFIHEQGGCVMTSSWAKFYLCLLGVMDWTAHNSVPPEMWLLPNFFPFHPGRMWCHARMVYLPMSYLYSRRYVYSKAETDPVTLSLRKELYCQDYDLIPWVKTRHWVAPMDNYSPISLFMRVAQNALARYESWPIFQPFKNFIRRYADKFCVDYMAAEDLQTNFIDIGPVNKVLNMISAFDVAGEQNHPTVMNHMLRVQDYLWVAEDGMSMQGYNGSQCWDTSFAVQAYYEAQLLDEFPETSQKAWSFLERCQILSTETSQATPAYKYESAEYRSKYYRHLSEGGWPFSTSAHGWPISDCSAEGLKGVLCLLKCNAVNVAVKEKKLNPINQSRLEKCISVMLTYQNEDGGWATYENNRGFGWYEYLNPSEAFGDIMIDYSYVECSMACLTALHEFHEKYPGVRSEEIMHALSRGNSFLKSIQREDGSWYGSWACCFCYGTWFGVEGLVKSGEPLDSPHLTKACEFFLKHQRANGGWGEDFTSCFDKDYAANGMDAYGDEGSSVVNTSWALLALSCAECKDMSAIQRGVQYLMKRQLPCGDWPQEGIAGVFNRSVGIFYTSYRNVFPIWALGRCRSVYGDTLDKTD